MAAGREDDDYRGAFFLDDFSVESEPFIGADELAGSERSGSAVGERTRDGEGFGGREGGLKGEGECHQAGGQEDRELHRGWGERIGVGGFGELM